MPRDLSGCGRYPPTPKYSSFAFYTCIRMGDPEQLAKIMATDTYFITQDNGGGAPVHFATTYKQLDMLHHLLNNGAEVNQRDSKGLTALHRAAFLAGNDAYLEIYEYLLSRGGDPEMESDIIDPYLEPVKKRPHEMCADLTVQRRLLELNEQYATVEKVREPHVDVGCWWTLYDYGVDVVRTWSKDCQHPYPETKLRERMREEKRLQRAARRERRAQGAFLKKGVLNTALETDSEIAFLFPGQGSQSIGMLSDSKHYPVVQDMLDKANKILGYDLLKLCLEGPKEALEDTVKCQPAMFVAGLVAVEKLKMENPDIVQNCSVTAGLSLGEYTALVFAGVLSFEDGLKVVKVRAESMAEAAQRGKPHGMLSIVGLPDHDIQQICAEVTGGVHNPDFVCQPANYLFPQGRVLSGHLEALEAARKLAIAKGALKAQKVAVSGAFHTALMEPAKAKLMHALSDVTFHKPRIPIYSNVTSELFGEYSEIPELLGQQLVQPVKWEQTLVKLIDSGKTKFYELGPGQQIKAMVKRLDTSIWKNFKNIAP